jgi:hypothetical protein
MDSRLEEARQFGDTFIRERRHARSISGVSMTSLSRLLLAHPSRGNCREGRPVTARKRTLALSRSLAARARARIAELPRRVMPWCQYVRHPMSAWADEF